MDCFGLLYDVSFCLELDWMSARALQGEGSRRAGLEALLNLAATAEGSSFLLSGHSINLAHLHLSLMDR